MTLFHKDIDVIRPGHRPAYISPDMWSRLFGHRDVGRRGKKVRLRMGVVPFASERKVCRRRRKIAVSDWAERHRVLTMSALPGKWHNSVTPYLTGIMDTMGAAFVREVVLCKTPQTGGSEATHNFIGYCIDRAPGAVLYVYPDEDTAKENSNDRVLPMIQSSPRLASYLTGISKDATSHRIGLTHMPVYFAWARSASKLANKPIKYGVADEIDKEGFNAGKAESHPLDLIDKRFVTYRSSYKFIKISTPTLETGNIWRALHAAEVIFDYHVRCPACTHLHLMAFEGIKWAGRSDADPDEIKNRHLAWYECPGCGEKWDDEIRNAAVRAGVWIARDLGIALNSYLTRFRPVTVGFHIPAWISYFVSLSECAAAFLKGLKDPLKLRDFKNGYCAEPWQAYEVLAQKDDEEILSCRSDLAPQVVPAPALAITCGIDVQKYGFPYVVRAWARDYTSWLLDYGTMGTWDEVEALLFTAAWPVDGSDTRRMGIWRAGIDTGGGKYTGDTSSTEDAYLWLQQHMFQGSCRVWGTKGSSTPLPGTKLKMGGAINKTPSGKPLKFGMRLVFLDTNRMKDLFYERIHKTLSGDAGGVWLHKETALAYARQITAERKTVNEKNIEVWEQIRKDNHYLDCECIAAALADWEWPGGGVHTLPDPGAGAAREPAKKEATPSSVEKRKRPGWFFRR